MTLECMVCGERNDAGPRYNPKIIPWICRRCFSTPEAQRLMDKLDEEEKHNAVR